MLDRKIHIYVWGSGKKSERQGRARKKDRERKVKKKITKKVFWRLRDKRYQEGVISHVGRAIRLSILVMMLDWAIWHLSWPRQEHFYRTTGDHNRMEQDQRKPGGREVQTTLKGKQRNGPVGGGECGDQGEVFCFC